jgi:hypothetical protein
MNDGEAGEYKREEKCGTDLGKMISPQRTILFLSR